MVYCLCLHVLSPCGGQQVDCGWRSRLQTDWRAADWSPFRSQQSPDEPPAEGPYRLASLPGSTVSFSPLGEWVWRLWRAVFFRLCSRTPPAPLMWFRRTVRVQTRWRRPGGSGSRSGCGWPRRSLLLCPDWKTHCSVQQVGHTSWGALWSTDVFITT